MSDLEDWTIKNSEPKENEDDLRVYNSEVSKENVFVFMSSHSLLKNIDNQQKVSPPYLIIDSSYKLTKNNYPLVTIGTMSNDRKYHLVALVIVSSENEQVYTKIFQTLIDIAKLEMKIDYKPQYCVSDDSQSIINSSLSVFGKNNRAFRHILCQFHLKKTYNLNLPNFSKDKSLAS